MKKLKRKPIWIICGLSVLLVALVFTAGWKPLNVAYHRIQLTRFTTQWREPDVHPLLRQAYGAMKSYHIARLVDLKYMAKKTYTIDAALSSEEVCSLLKHLNRETDSYPHFATMSSGRDPTTLVLWANHKMMPLLEQVVNEKILPTWGGVGSQHGAEGDAVNRTP